MSSQTALIEHQRVATIVEGVNQARADALEGFRLLSDAKTRLAAIFGAGHAGGFSDTLWEDRISDTALLKRQAPETDTLIACNTWRYLLRVMQVFDYMTDARIKECEGQLARGEFPALTVENIQHTCEGLTNQVGTLLVESVKDVCDWLRPHHRYGVGTLKTNKTFRVGYAVILAGMVVWQRSWFRLSYCDSRVPSLGKVLSLLDGQGVPHYPNDLVTQLDALLHDAQPGQELTLPYFTCRPRKNGHLAIVFTRHDLIDRLNQIGSDGSLGVSTAG